MARQSKLNRVTQRAIKSLQHNFEIAAASRLTVQQTSGPIPDPQTLRQYNEITPGLADRIVRMAEDEALHRRGLERTIVDAQSDDIKSQRTEIRLGQVFAVVVAVAGFGFGTYAMTHGAQIGGSVLGGGTLVSIVGAFLYRQHAASKAPDEPKASPVQKAQAESSAVQHITKS